MKPFVSDFGTQNQEVLREEIKLKQNEFLDVYSFYCKTRIAWIHDELKLKAYELHLLDPHFAFSL